MSDYNPPAKLPPGKAVTSNTTNAIIDALGGPLGQGAAVFGMLNCRVVQIDSATDTGGKYKGRSVSFPPKAGATGGTWDMSDIGNVSAAVDTIVYHGPEAGSGTHDLLGDGAPTVYVLGFHVGYELITIEAVEYRLERVVGITYWTLPC